MIDLNNFLTKNELEDFVQLISLGGGALRASGVSEHGSLGGDSLLFKQQSLVLLHSYGRRNSLIQTYAPDSRLQRSESVHAHI